MRRYTKPQKNPSKTLMIIAIGAVMMLALDTANTYLQKRKLYEQLSQKEITQVVPIPSFEKAEQIPIESDVFDELLSSKIPQPDPVMNDLLLEQDIEVKEESLEPPPIKKPTKQAWKDDAVSVETPEKKTKVVIIIDDMGMARKYSNDVIDIAAPLTLAFLPYAPNLEDITDRAKKQGHELLIHMPMEPLSASVDPGPIALRSGMNKEEIDAQLQAAFQSFDGYIGINNHMGSKVTQDEPILHHVMNSLAEHGLAFVDSKTTADSRAGKIAAQHGLDYAERDIFLDHEDNINFVRNALKQLERVSRANGSAIAIGHPKAATIQGLREWIPTLEKKGIVIVPVSNVLKNGLLEHGTLKITKTMSEKKEFNNSEELIEDTLIEPAAGEAPLSEAQRQEAEEKKALIIKPFPDSISTFSQPDPQPSQRLE